MAQEKERWKERPTILVVPIGLNHGISVDIADLTDPSAQPSYLTNDPEATAASSSSFGGPRTLGGTAAAAAGGGGGNAWETRFGLRVDLEAAIAYLGGPVTGERARFANQGHCWNATRCGERADPGVLPFCFAFKL